jgi:hypothetical protein
MIHRNRSNIDKFREIVLVRNVVSVPSYDVKWRVLLSTLEELAAEFVDDFPRCLLDLVLGDWVEEVSSISEAVCTEWT